MKSEVTQKWDKRSADIFEKFAAELEEYTKTQELPAHASQDIQFCLELQQERLAGKNLKMVYEFTPRGHFANGAPGGKHWSDGRYSNDMRWRTCNLTRTISQNEKKIYKKGQNEILYETMTTVLDEHMVGEDLYTCPNCAAVSRIKELREGCPYCGTYFEMKDLFPKITNYFCVKDFGGTETEIKSEVLKFILPCAIPAILIFTLIYWIGGSHFLLALFSGVLGGSLFGAVMGYLVWCVYKISSLFAAAGKSTGALVNSAGSSKRFVAIMQQHSPEFSYEYFTGKVVSLLKMMIFAQDVQKLPYYKGEPVGDLFANVVDSSYFGAVALKKCEVQGDYVYVTAEVYMDNLYERDGHVGKRDEKFRMQLYKRIDRAVDYNFSIKKIQCKSCGSSFDATKQSTCPSCGCRYEIGDDDWVVVNIGKK